MTTKRSVKKQKLTLVSKNFVLTSFNMSLVHYFRRRKGDVVCYLTNTTAGNPYY